MKYVCVKRKKIYAQLFNEYDFAKKKCDELNKVNFDRDMWYPIPIYERNPHQLPKKEEHYAIQSSI